MEQKDAKHGMYMTARFCTELRHTPISISREKKHFLQSSNFLECDTPRTSAWSQHGHAPPAR
jgi:hypothetical protein